MVSVESDTDFCQVGVENINLITSTGGKCHASPQIYNNSDTARVSMGSNTELLDQERTYYLQTRGLSQASAEAMLISAHRTQVLSIIQNAAIKEEIEQLLVS
jgi:Fe-S cluster assembly protein SufD